MATAQDLIKSALRKINSYWSGDTFAAMDANDGLEVLNDLPLPTCNSTLQGSIMMVSNGVATPTYLATPSTTGSSYDLVACNGSTWQHH